MRRIRMRLPRQQRRLAMTGGGGVVRNDKRAFAMVGG